MQAAKVAKAVALVLAVLIVVAFGAVVWAILNLDGRGGEERGLAQGEAAGLATEIALGLPQTCDIAAIDLDGGRLAVHAAGPAGTVGCNRVYIVDLARGTVIGTVVP